MSLLSTPLNAHVLQALADEPKSLVDLRRAAGSPPQTTMRGHLKALTSAGILERRRVNDFPGSVDYELRRPGQDLLPVVEVLRGWLAVSPEGELELGTPAAKSAIKALVEGWSAGVVRALAARPFSLTKLSSIITGLSYPALERRLGAMRLAGLIEPCPGVGRGTHYKASEWLRCAIAPLAAAARWERQHLPEQTTPIGKIDIESAFLLALPLASLPGGQTGDCRLVVEMRNRQGETRLAGAMSRVKDGRVVSCVARLDGEATAYLSGSAGDWLRAVFEDDKRGLDAGGDCDLAFALLDGLHSVLFRARQRA